MRPDMQPENTQYGAGATELQPESDGGFPPEFTADQLTVFIEPVVNGGEQAQFSEARLAAILLETPDFVAITDVEGDLLFVNGAGRKMIGLGSSESLASKKIFDCHPDWASRIIRQDGIPTALQDVTGSRETAALTLDGVEIPVLQVIIAHRNDAGGVEYLSTVLRDVTERKRAEMIQVRLRRQAALRAAVSVALAEREAPLSEILLRCSEAVIWHLDAALARIWLHNSEDRTLDAVASAGATVNSDGTDRTDATDGIRGQSDGSAVANGFAAGLVAKTMQPYWTNDVVNDVGVADIGWLKEWLRLEGITAFAAFPMIVSDCLIGVLAVFARHALEDDTLGELNSLAGLIARGVERRKADEESQRELAREREARAAAEDASRLKDDFLAMISHDLRAPLTSILGWVRMLRAGAMDEATIERALHTIEKNVTTQARLIGDLLDASRIATGRLQLDMGPVDLMSVIETAVDTVRPLIEEKRLRLQMTLEPWVGPFNGDQERLKQVVWNLLTNAIKFTPPEEMIEVRLERLEDKALLIVSDTGQGIDPEFLPHVFDQFSQADALSTRREGQGQGGLGLGLAIVKRLVELHGGAIYPFSRGQGQGTDFMITLPLGIAQQPGREAFRRFIQSGAGKRSSALEGLRVLVVDDEFDTREVLGTMLTRYGAETRSAESASEALQMLVEWKPDVLVSDIGMPVEDGFDLIAKVRALPADQGGAIPAIALTAFASSQDRQRALSNGFQTHLTKPVEPVELAQVIARAAGRDEKAIV